MPKWLKCKVDKGMFRDEFTVTVHTAAGEAIAVFVPKDCADDRRTLVQVSAFEQQGKTITPMAAPIAASAAPHCKI